MSTAITCPTLSAPADGRVTYSTSLPFVSGTLATYFCDTGFGLSGGDVTSICGGDGSSPNGMWSGTPPVCEGTCIFVCGFKQRWDQDLFLYSTVIVCPGLSAPSNGQVSYTAADSTYYYGTVATYTCLVGFGRNGIGTSTCGGDGSSTTGVWSGTPPTCDGMYFY